MTSMSLHKLGDTKTEPDKYNHSFVISKKVKGRSVRGVFRRVTFIHEVLPPLIQEVPFYRARKWLYTLQVTQRCYRRVRTFA